MNKSGWLIPFSVLIGASAPIEAICEIYMSEESATQIFFPGAKFSKKQIALTDEEIKTIEKASDETVRSKQMTVWQSSIGTVFIDRVLGKHEMITYAVGIDPQGAVKGIEILEYRETYGHQVRKPDWRQQFVGKTIQSPLKLDEDIKNISGATLSSAHVTAGVKRVLHSFDKIKTRL